MPLWARGAIMGACFFVTRAIFHHQPFSIERFLIFVVLSMVVYPLVSKFLKLVFS